MPTPITLTDLLIVNQALAALGENGITNLQDDDTPHGIVMRSHYETTSEAAQTKTAWRFNTSKVALNLLSGEPLNRWSAAWQLPPDNLKVLHVWPPTLYELHGDKLLSNDNSQTHIDYTRKLEESLWPAWFVRYMRAELVMVTCRGITGDDPDQTMKDERETAENNALTTDSQQQPNQTALPSDFIDVRF